ncbi:MAG: APC family permease [Candidatus Odinarchaeia archaeon]
MSEEEIPTVFVRKATGLRRELGATFSIAYPLNLVIGPWIFLYLPIVMATTPGADLMVALALDAIPAFIFMLNALFLAIAMPRSGGDYTWVSRTIHPSIGYIFNGFASIAISLIVLGSIAVFIPILWGFSLFTIGMLGVPTLIDPALVLMSDTVIQIIFAVIAIIVFIILDALGPTFMKWINYVFFVVTMVFTVLLFAVLGLTSPSAVPTIWDTVWGSGAYQEIIDVSTTYGWTAVPLNFPDTLSAMRTLYFLFLGGTALGFFGSEIKVPKKSFTIGFMGGICIITAIYLGLTALILTRFGDFASRYSYIMLAEGEIPTTINPWLYPLANVFAVSLTTNPVLQIILAVGPAIWALAFFPTMLPGITRVLFAMSFDRFLPEQITRVSERTGAPYVASIVVGVMAVICTVIYAYAGWLATALGAISLSTLTHLFHGFANVTMPYTKPAIWEGGLTYKIGGMPVSSILGLFTISFPGFFMLFFTMLEADTLAIALGGILVGLGILLFLYYCWKNTKEGIDINKIYGEVPPT